MQNKKSSSRSDAVELMSGLLLKGALSHNDIEIFVRTSHSNPHFNNLQA